MSSRPEPVALHLSLVHGAETEERCVRCGAVRYIPDSHESRRRARARAVRPEVLPFGQG